MDTAYTDLIQRMAPDTRRFLLNNGHAVPAVGVGCWMGRVGEGEHVVQMVKNALEIGYRHIDTAAMYDDEVSVGQAIRESKLPREEIFITTKLAGKDHRRASAALDRSLQKLGVEYVDLYLMHWPQAERESGEVIPPEGSPTFVDTWKDMEKLVESGKARSIGVSNFSIKNLKVLLPHARIVPAVNQIEAHPCLPGHALLAFCKAHGIHVTAYAPVAKGKLGEVEDLVAIAQSKGVTVAQVLLSWGVQRGTSVIPKTENPQRLKENISLVELSPDDMEVLDKLHEKSGMHHSMCGFHSPALGGSAFGWTYEQLGWDMTLGGIVKSS
ncbi:putative aldo/keto reductase family protein [Lyophyllum shimeji]|uniref:Aldo/keto reductase family protein n=1 Tax=Lyophyllum shimeji TaxID=47721 RepID=A0A9P3PT20_LYOSH|nr:putative aldo/keto reductase family protein [Lyophyllum shimeji]